MAGMPTRRRTKRARRRMERACGAAPPRPGERARFASAPKPTHGVPAGSAVPCFRRPPRLCAGAAASLICLMSK